MSLRRRFFLLGGAAAGALIVAGGGAAVLLADPFERWIRDLLERSLPGYTLEPRGFAQFVDEYDAKKKAGRRLRIFTAAQGVVDAKWALPRDIVADFESEERKVVSDFLVGSDFFDKYPNNPRQITYRGKPEACGNPFATF